MSLMKNAFSFQQPIGIFDSGVGGLSVLRAIRQELPHEDILYLADQTHIPYGPRSAAEIQDFSHGICNFLLEQGAKLIVVACNTASAAALNSLRQSFPQVSIVGMEPAIKPAAETTQSGKVGVLATPTTFSSDLYASLLKRFAQDVEIYQSTCPGLVEQIEAGALNSPHTRHILQNAIGPMQEAGVDTIVLGCTHYPFVIPLIRSITGVGVQIIDPAPAVARQVGHLLSEKGLCNEGRSGGVHFFTSGSPIRLAGQLMQLIGETGHVEKVIWSPDLDLRLIENPSKE
jgi:glutamate racemase